MPRMDFDLSPDHELIRRTVRDFAEGEVAPVAEELDRTKAFPYAIVKQLGELGLMGIPFPEEYGGAGGDSLAYAIAVEELTRVDSSVAITMCAHTSLGTQPIYLFGSEEQKQRYLPDLCAGKRLGAVGLTQPQDGSDARNTHAPPRRAPGGASGAPVSACPAPRRAAPPATRTPARASRTATGSSTAPSSSS